MNNRDCPVCNCSSKKELAHIKFSLPEHIKLPSSYNVVECDNCGMCYSDTTATIEDYDSYYINCNYYSGNTVTDNSAIIDAIVKHCPSEYRILDMGFGNGQLLNSLKLLGFSDLSGIDPSIDSVNHLKSEGIHQAYQGSIFSLPEKKFFGQFDCCCLTSVLEHLLDPQEAIHNLSQYIKSNGLLVLDIPDYSQVDSVDAAIPNQFNQEHINYFSKESIEWLMNSAGFVSLEYIDFPRYNKDSVEHSLIGVFRKDDTYKAKNIKDKKTALSIERYINTQKTKEMKRKIIIDQLIHDDKKVYIWGTGSFVSYLMETTNINKCNILSFIDNNHLKQGKVFYGFPSISPSEIVDSNAVIVIATMMFTDSIMKQICEMNIKNEVVPLALL
ncbi:bifunctional 3-demethylubiquinone-9 3-methyltransferase/ 2-octaprenyl-6-hydroxy phenol methylase [compost metagenome]